MSDPSAHSQRLRSIVPVDLPPAVGPASARRQPGDVRERARGLTKFWGDVVALDGVDLDVAPGQIHGIVGPNGAGKTTLLGLLLGVAVADRGSLEVLGSSVGRVLAATGATGSGIDAGTLRQSLALSFGHLYVVQGQEVNHLNVTSAQLRTTASCAKGAGLVAQDGPGNDWRCYVNWHIPGVNDAIAQAVYQLDVNPLWEFGGLVDRLAPASNG